MSDRGQETEVKFYIRNLGGIKKQLEALAARLIQDRVLETNIRFDVPGEQLRARGRVLRLWRDTTVRLTYKGASTNEQGVLSREEIELFVDDFEKARRFLEALGYQKLVYYEKYRTTMSWTKHLLCWMNYLTAISWKSREKVLKEFRRHRIDCTCNGMQRLQPVTMHYSSVFAEQ